MDCKPFRMTVRNLVIGVNRNENQDFEFRQPLYIVDVETKEETVLVDEDGYFGGAAIFI